MRIERAFPNLLTRLFALYNGEPFSLDTTIRPVTIVDSEISFTTIVIPPLWGRPFTEGQLTAPGVGVLLADSGARVAGTYDYKLLIAGIDNVNNCSFDLELRDAANAATLAIARFYHGANAASQMIHHTLEGAMTLLTNERIRIIVGPTAVAAGNPVFACLWMAAR